MKTKEEGKIIKKVCWTQTLRALEIGQIIRADMSDRINIVRHTTRLKKIDGTKYSTRKISDSKIEIIRIY